MFKCSCSSEHENISLVFCLLQMIDLGTIDNQATPLLHVTRWCLICWLAGWGQDMTMARWVVIWGSVGDVGHWQVLGESYSGRRGTLLCLIHCPITVWYGHIQDISPHFLLQFLSSYRAPFFNARPFSCYLSKNFTLWTACWSECEKFSTTPAGYSPIKGCWCYL